jgi:K+ transporter
LHSSNDVYNIWPLQRAKTAGLFYLAFQTLGVVYGDIGTSPLYAFSSIFDFPPSEEDVIGAVSLVLWSLTAIVSFKYALIVLQASDSGQGKADDLASRKCVQKSSLLRREGCPGRGPV